MNDQFSRTSLPASAPAREMPASEEAEQHVIACCLLDGTDTIARCIEARIEPDSFFWPANQDIFRIILDLYHKSPPVTVEMMAEELKARRLLEQVGGFAYLMQVTGKIPTTAHAGYMIDKVRAKHLLREFIRGAGSAIEKAYNFAGALPEIDALAAETCAQITPATRQAKTKELSFGELLLFDTTKDPDCILGTRYLGRTNGAVIVAPSGIGKSVLSVQIGLLASSGLPIFGLRPAFALRVLYVQAEDDTGDVAEAVQGVTATYALNGAQKKMVEANFRAVRWPDVTGERFTVRLLGEWSRWPFDLVIINPLFSFAGCDLIDHEATSHFFRHLLNPLLVRTRAAAIVVHHTKKPSNDPKNQSGEENAAYDPFGSSEITNWARAIISLQMVRGSGNKVCKLVFGKRGTRAGIVDADGNPATSVTIEHAKHGLCWVPSDWRPTQGETGRFETAKWDRSRAMSIYDSALGWPENKRRIAAALGMSERAVHDHRDELEAA